jgi:hypothetical protein
LRLWAHKARHLWHRQIRGIPPIWRLRAMERDRTTVREQEVTLEQQNLDDMVLERVRSALLLIDRRLSREDLALHTSLVDDLAVDSLKLVDLAFVLEESLELDEFPLQDWADEEKRRVGKRFTLASLAAFCLLCVQRNAHVPSA